MSDDSLIVPKTLKSVHLWVHPEGRVPCGIFLQPTTADEAVAGEHPIDLLNKPEPFLVCRCGQQGDRQTRFYSKNAIVRVDYSESPQQTLTPGVRIRAEFQLMDGALFHGEIREDLPPDRQRLLDYMNVHTDRFVRLFLEQDNVTLINKAYIMRVVPLGD
ncbi:hypothetical protein [Acidihalobacter ferrooxydans]|uniref:Uncharacterized protein n=1 Tax=Acidihalobacter ferrooxydans TaxID=1765967 RepID=A0A1P8UE32_9GAMM|nr:hypothetical protein [Acidihalobacter ferrooxydans]APZ42121.1 hypothetical protein BW247_02595 [Acidihalobacter ferrooxydans]